MQARHGVILVHSSGLKRKVGSACDIIADIPKPVACILPVISSPTHRAVILTALSTCQSVCMQSWRLNDVPVYGSSSYSQIMSSRPGSAASASAGGTGASQTALSVHSTHPQSHSLAAQKTSPAQGPQASDHAPRHHDPRDQEQREELGGGGGEEISGIDVPPAPLPTEDDDDDATLRLVMGLGDDDDSTDRPPSPPGTGRHGEGEAPPDQHDTNPTGAATSRRMSTGEEGVVTSHEHISSSHTHPLPHPETPLSSSPPVAPPLPKPPSYRPLAIPQMESNHSQQQAQQHVVPSDDILRQLSAVSFQAILEEIQRFLDSVVTGGPSGGAEDLIPGERANEEGREAHGGVALSAGRGGEEEGTAVEQTGMSATHTIPVPPLQDHSAHNDENGNPILGDDSSETPHATPVPPSFSLSSILPDIISSVACEPPPASVSSGTGVSGESEGSRSGEGPPSVLSADGGRGSNRAHGTSGAVEARGGLEGVMAEGIDERLLAQLAAAAGEQLHRGRWSHAALRKL